jgi:uncharacterized membrane protein YdjX (TVP38/TMEM64 family)
MRIFSLRPLFMPFNRKSFLSYIKYLPVVVLLFLILLVYLSGLMKYLNFDTLKTYRLHLLNLVHYHLINASLIFIGLYALSTALSLPAGGVFTLTAGFLFPLPLAFACSIIGSTIGSFILFLIAQTTLKTLLRDRAPLFLKKMSVGIKEHTVSYLLFLRFIPIIPFWLVNLIPAFFKIHWYTYLWTTFIGVMPGSFIFNYAGIGLGKIFGSNKPFSLDLIFNKQLKIALILLAIFALTPIFCKKWLKKFNKHNSNEH